jgi:hypothetical protein
MKTTQRNHDSLRVGKRKKEIIRRLKEQKELQRMKENKEITGRMKVRCAVSFPCEILTSRIFARDVEVLLVFFR